MTWEQLMGELKERGWTQPKLRAWLESKDIECGQSTLSDLASGKTQDPKFKVGNALRELHASGEAYVATA
jgi:hypothetical protein